MHPRLLIVPCLILVFAGLLRAQNHGEAPPPGEFFRDPEWRAHFLGSYGFLADVEPSIQPEEQENLREVLTLMENSGTSAAANRLQETITADSSAALLFVLGNLHFQSGNRDRAKANYRAAIDKHGDFRRAHKNLGLLLVQDRDYKSARRHLSRAVELGAREGRTFGLLGFVNMRLGDRFGAEAAYRDAIAQEPEQIDWKLGLAQVLSEMEDYEALLKLIDSLLQNRPGDPQLWMLKANAHVDRNELVPAAAALEIAATLGESSIQLRQLLSDIYMQLELYEDAEAVIGDIIREGDYPETLDNALRAIRLMYRTDNFDNAQRLLNAARERFGDQLTDAEELDCLTLEARIQRVRGNRHQAAGAFEEILRRDRTRGDVLLELAKYHWNEAEAASGNRPSESSTSAPAASDQSPGMHRAKALEYLREAAAFPAFEFDALLQHAQFLVQLSSFAEAAEKLRAALKIKDQPRVRRFLNQVEEAGRLR